MNVFDRFSAIDTFIFDIDGVWTNSNMLVTESGELLRTMTAKDGYAAHTAIRKGYNMVIITGGISKGVKDRLQKLGASEIHIGIKDKTSLLLELATSGKVNLNTSLYMGDDIPDIGALNAVHLSTCPQDAVAEVLETCDYISPYAGGKGCVRDVIERVMRIQNKW